MSKAKLVFIDVYDAGGRKIKNFVIFFEIFEFFL